MPFFLAGQNKIYDSKFNLGYSTIYDGIPGAGNKTTCDYYDNDFDDEVLYWKTAKHKIGAGKIIKPYSISQLLFLKFRCLLQNKT